MKRLRVKTTSLISVWTEWFQNKLQNLGLGLVVAEEYLEIV